MIRKSKPAYVLAWLLVTLSVAASTGGKVILNADNGASERIVDTPGKLKNDVIGVLWLPELEPATSSYGVTGSCRRIDPSSGEYVGSHKVKFTQVSIEGLSSNFSLEVPNFKSTLKNGRPAKVQVVDITSQVRQALGAEEVLLGAAQVKLTGVVEAGHYVQCFFGIVEGDATLIPMSATAEQRQVALEEVARTTIFREFDPEFE